jgi:amino acid permease
MEVIIMSDFVHNILMPGAAMVIVAAGFALFIVFSPAIEKIVKSLIGLAFIVILFLIISAFVMEKIFPDSVTTLETTYQSESSKDSTKNSDEKEKKSTKKNSSSKKSNKKKSGKKSSSKKSKKAAEKNNAE